MRSKPAIRPVLVQTAVQSRVVNVMRNECCLPAIMSIDTKRGRIRIHKAVLHQLGDPQYIQLLVNPSDMVVAVRCIDAPLFEYSVHMINRNRFCSAFSY